MNVVRRNPSSVAGLRQRGIDDQFGRLIETMFDDMFAPFTQGGALSQRTADAAMSPRLNVSETEAAFEVQAELPGVRKEDVKVAVEHQRVTIEAQAQHDSAQREGENVLYCERSASRFLRSFMLPSEVDDTLAQARMENGVLMLTLPKKNGGVAKRITIQ